MLIRFHCLIRWQWSGRWQGLDFHQRQCTEKSSLWYRRHSSTDCVAQPYLHEVNRTAPTMPQCVYRAVLPVGGVVIGWALLLHLIAPLQAKRYRERGCTSCHPNTQRLGTDRADRLLGWHWDRHDATVTVQPAADELCDIDRKLSSSGFVVSEPGRRLLFE